MTRRRWFLGAATAGLLALLAFASAGCGFGPDSPREFVQGEYKRASAQDIDGAALAYTSPKSPAAVEKAITKDWQPIDRFGNADGIYLRYTDDVVTVHPDGSGSVIRVESGATACARHRNTVGPSFVCNPGGDTARGGGPGEGK